MEKGIKVDTFRHFSDVAKYLLMEVPKGSIKKASLMFAPTNKKRGNIFLRKSCVTRPKIGHRFLHKSKVGPRLCEIAIRRWLYYLA